MQELYNKLKKYSIYDVIKIEETDRQYIALKKLWNNLNRLSYDCNMCKGDIYLSLILANSIICYQLSWKWEDYWEEFSNYFVDFFNLSKINNLNSDSITLFLSNFIKQSKNNRRFINIKINRLKKMKPFLENFLWNTEYYYDNMETLRDEIVKTMNQKKDAKTIVFAIKMFSYWSRNVFDKLNYFPEKISIPIDSRLINLFVKYWNNNMNYESIDTSFKKNIFTKDIKRFYFDLAKKIGIPELHLDALVWINYNELMI